MTCEECLTEMETIATIDVPGSAVALHSAHCSACASVLQAITDADRLMMQERDETYFTSSAADVAQRAVVLGQRRNVFAGISVLSLVLLGASVWYAGTMLSNSERTLRYLANRNDPELQYAPAAVVGVPAPPTSLLTESFDVRCLGRESVRQLISPYLTSRGSQLIWTDPPLHVLTIKASESDMPRIRDMLKRFDTPEYGKCALPRSTPETTK